jgi:hypothetical protein
MYGESTQETGGEIDTSFPFQIAPSQFEPE